MPGRAVGAAGVTTDGGRSGHPFTSFMEGTMTAKHETLSRTDRGALWGRWASPGRPQVGPDVALASGRRVALALRSLRHAIASRFLESIATWSKYADDIHTARAGGGLDELVAREFHAHVDYLASYCESGDTAYRDLYIGEKIKEAYDVHDPSLEAQLRRREEIVRGDAGTLLRALQDRVADHDLEWLRLELQKIGQILTSRARRTLSVLLIGDCLFLDVMAFLPALCLEDGIAVAPTFMASKNPAELRNTIRRLVGQHYDLVFISPFTYAFTPGYARLLETASALASRRTIATAVDEALADTRKTLELLAETFDCSLFVHNSAQLRRHHGGIVDRLRQRLTRRTRSRARSLANARIDELLAELNQQTFEHLFLFDEMLLLEEHGEWELGRHFYDAELQHPAIMGQQVARGYADLLAVHAHLRGRKLVVCDLDNTLWKGVIGEGAVEHYLDRQRILKKLQARGVVLAINSKNDPANVHWTGGLLCARDFVCSEINWELKVANLARIAQTLNLKTKDFVFVDDRADERALVESALPEVHVLDATAPRSWRLLESWAQCLPARNSGDRTEAYRQKAQRDDFLRLRAEEDPGTLFAQLGITVCVRQAQRGDLQRVVELINRTNQFNTTASRTTLKAMADTLAADDAWVLLGDAADRFGSMGIVSVLVLRRVQAYLEIATFVLSCRVFGYGIETVLLNSARRLARAKQLVLSGRYIATAHNEPCRAAYPDHGFMEKDGVWIDPGDRSIEDPYWLSAKCQVPGL